MLKRTIAALGTALALTSCTANGNNLDRDVQTSMQEQFDTDAPFSSWHLTVNDVDLLHQSGNEYTGIAKVSAPRTGSHDVIVHVTTDGRKFMWHTDPGAFLWAAMS